MSILARGLAVGTIAAVEMHNLSALELGDGANANTFDAGSTNTLSVMIRN